MLYFPVWLRARAPYEGVSEGGGAVADNSMGARAGLIMGTTITVYIRAPRGTVAATAPPLVLTVANDDHSFWVNNKTFSLEIFTVYSLIM